MVAGTPADHFSANFDIDKALHKSSRKAYSDKARLHVQALLTALGVKTLIQPGELWLAPNGSPRRFLLHLQEQPLTHVKELVDLDLTFDDPGRPAELSMPAADQLVEVDLLHQFLQATGAAGATDR